jgi:hypothetical protein
VTILQNSRLLLGPVITLAVILGACGGDNDEPESPGWPAFFTPNELVAASDAIVVATLLEETVENIEVPATGDEGGIDVVTEIIRTFRVDDAVGGGLFPGDLIHTFSTASVAHEPADGGNPSEVVFQVLQFESGDTLLLFLSLVVLPDYYPETWGTVAWAAPGEPSAARVSPSGELQWETTGRYDQVREDRKLPAGRGGAGEAFDISLDDLRELAAPPDVD